MLSKNIRMRIFEGLINMGVLFIALNVMTEMDPDITEGQLVFLMLAGAASDIFYVLRYWKKGWYPKLKYIVSAGIKISAASVLFAATHDYDVYILLYVIVIMYYLIFPFGSALKMIHNKKPRNIISFIMVLGFFGYMTYSTFTDDYGLALGITLVSIFSMVSSLVRVMATSFSGIKMNILRKIIRKTYAVEILFGLLLLIISFSMVFYRLEPDFNGYGDALWYSFALFTTIGFGDRVATTVVGRLLSVILGSYGIIVVALITSIVVNFYNEVKSDDDDDDDEIEYDEEGNEVVKVDEKLQEKVEKDIEKKMVKKDNGDDDMPF